MDAATDNGTEDSTFCSSIVDTWKQQTQLQPEHVVICRFYFVKKQKHWATVMQAPVLWVREIKNLR